MNIKVVICAGVSGSGKTTWSTQFIKENSDYLRINRDGLRYTLTGDTVSYYQREDINKSEAIINHLESQLFLAYTNNKYNIIIDNTNLTQKYINKWFRLAQLNKDKYNAENPDNPIDYDIQFKFFDCEVSRAKLRVTHRDTPPYSLDYIDKQYNQYIDIKKWILDNHSDKIIEDGKK